MSLKEKITKIMPFNWGKKPLDAGTSSTSSLPALRRDIDEMFERMRRDLFRPWAPLSGLSDLAEDLLGTEWPRVDLEEGEKELRVIAEVPGVEEKDLEVTLDENLLVIRGERHDTKESREGGWYRKESYSGSFNRSIRLPAEVDVERAEAKCRRGELVIRLPKKHAEGSERRRITVR